MKIVIDISEEMYMDCINNVTDEDKCYAYSDYCLRYAIRNGQVLPKGHGRLYDEKVLHDYWGEKYDLPLIPCVIEADKENDNDLQM